MKLFKLEKLDLWILLVLLICLLPMAVIPFQDTTEPRYAEIARLMLSSGDWITPWFEPNVPFWGKPPLSFWAQAGSMALFGVNEFAARLPSWLATLISMVFLYQMMSTLYGRRSAQYASLVLVSLALVFICSGAVLTDPFLALGTNLIFCSFIMLMAQERHHGFWSYVFFIGVSIGLLAKGPLTLVIVGLPIGLWLVLDWTRFRVFYKRIVWTRGLILTVILVLPWYIMAEIKTPGFLYYFLVGEHVLRFIDSGWKGDLYGTAHQQVHGMIWLNMMVAGLPWWPIIPITTLVALKHKTLGQHMRILKGMPMFSLVVAWALSCASFFTFSGNILWTYVLPSMIGLAVIVAWVIGRLEQTQSKPLKWHYLSLLMPILLSLAMLIGQVYPNLWRTEKSLIEYVQQQQDTVPVYYFDEHQFSARFYSRDSVRTIQHDHYAQLADSPGDYYVAVNREHMDDFQPYYRDDLHAVFENKRFVLYKRQSAPKEIKLSPVN